VIANDSYEQVARVRAGDGLQADLHDVELTPSGAAFITVYYPVRVPVGVRMPAGVRMSVRGPKGLAGAEGSAGVKGFAGAKGSASASGSAGAARSEVVLDSIVQEIDVHTGLVMWEWQSLGHVPLAQSHQPPPKSGPYDYFHLDSLQQLPDGDLLIGARNTWAAYDLRMHTGGIDWQLGGRLTSFTLGPGVRFAWPEEVEMLGGKQLAVYDGGVSSSSAPRGEILNLERASKAASLAPAGQLRRSLGPPRSPGEGGVQALADGNWLIGWAGLPNFTEFDREGSVVYDARFPASEVGYRIYRAQWHAKPTAQPNVVASASATNTTVYASWNGATEVAAWTLLAGPSPLALEPVASAPSNDFEVTISTHPAAYVQVQALNAAGEVLTESKTIAVAHS
jgi:hypothetical protein